MTTSGDNRDYARLARRYEEGLDAAGEGIYGLDERGRVTFANQAAARMVGWEAEDLVGRRMHEEIHHSRPDGSPYPLEECPIYETLRDGTVHDSVDEVFWRADGTSFPVRYTAAPIFEDGRVAGAVVTFSEVTERKRAEEVVRESEARLSAIFSQAAAGISEISPEGRFLRVNEELCRILGRTEEELLGMSVPEVTHPEDAAESLATFGRTVETGEPSSLDKRYQRPDGEAVPANSSLTLLAGERGGERTVLAVTADLTGRRRAEEALRESEERQAFLLRLSDRIRDLKSQEEIGEVCTRLLAGEMDLDRVYFARFSPEEDRALIGPEYRSPDLEPVSGSYPFSAFPEAIRKIQTETPVRDDVANDSTLPEAEKQALLRLGFGAWIGAPIRTEEKDVDWALYAVTTEPHTWTDNEVSLVGETAERTWAAVQRARAEEALRDREERLHLATEAAEIGIWELDLTTNDSPVRSERHDRIFGYEKPIEDWSLGIFLDHVHPEDRRRVASSFEEALREGLWEFECRIIRADGQRRWITTQGEFYYERGERGSEPRRAVGTVQDVTARKRAEEEREQVRQRTMFLSEASRRLAQSLDWEQTLSEVARLAVPRICDLCVVDTLQPPGEGSIVRRLAAAHHDPEKERLAWELEERYPVAEDPNRVIARVLRTGEPVLVEEIDEEWIRRMSQDEGQRKILEGLGLGSIVIVPLLIHGRTLGALTLAADGSGRHYGEEDLALAEDLARRAAQSMDNARLYEEQSHAARTLQQSLLPPSLPEIPGIQATARYRPAASAGGGSSGGFDIGGDFYDVFATPAGWAVVMGDVMGKGIEAAELTAMTRYTVRTAAMNGEEPSRVLRTLNAAMINQRSDMRFCTLVAGQLNLLDGGDGEAGDGGARLTLSRGGHPPPLLLRADGTVEAAETPGTLVGVFADAHFEDQALTLVPGDALVLYTDGVIEARNPAGELFGEERLKELVRHCGGLGAEEMADELERGVDEFQQGEGARDDVAILVLKATAS